MPSRVLRSLLLVALLVIAAHRPVIAQLRQDSLVQLVTVTGTIAGSLLVPKAIIPIPVVLIIAGSGPTDRNGNSGLLQGSNNSLQQIAQVLYSAGIASLRYDKRGVARSRAAATSEADLRFDAYIDDAVLWINTLRADPRFSTITIAGHSEGSLVGMIAARLANADGYVSISGPGRNTAEVLRGQMRSALPDPLFQAGDSILRDLEAGRTHVSGVPPQLAAIFRPSLQPYMISFFRYNPAAEISRLQIPVLILQGTTDIQVSVVDARALAAAKPDAQLEIVDGMNHVLKAVPSDNAQQAASYSDPSLPINPRLAAVLPEFVHRIVRRKG